MVTEHAREVAEHYELGFDLATGHPRSPTALGNDPASYHVQHVAGVFFRLGRIADRAALRLARSGGDSVLGHAYDNVAQLYGREWFNRFEGTSDASAAERDLERTRSLAAKQGVTPLR
jgi:hypothetical protein